VMEGRAVWFGHDFVLSPDFKSRFPLSFNRMRKKTFEGKILKLIYNVCTCPCLLIEDRNVSKKMWYLSMTKNGH
jgi:hypothetical protein